MRCIILEQVGAFLSGLVLKSVTQRQPFSGEGCTLPTCSQYYISFITINIYKSTVRILNNDKDAVYILSRESRCENKIVFLFHYSSCILY